MAEQADINAAVWKSADSVRAWIDDVEPRQRLLMPQWRLMGHLLPFEENAAFTFVDLGAGTGAAARAILDLYPRSHAVLADFSREMMAGATPMLQPYAGRFEYVEFDMTTSDWPVAIPPAVDAVVSSQCVHHLPDQRKRSLFAEIFDRLRPGGWYLNLDPVASDDPVVDAAWRRAGDRLDPAAAAQRAHRTPEEEARHQNHVRHLIGLKPQLEFLRDAGFAAVEVYWKHLDYVVYGGIRPSGTTG
jgi:tRNA (cmo5U34)-methyltransferase